MMELYECEPWNIRVCIQPMSNATRNVLKKKKHLIHKCKSKNLQRKIYFDAYMKLLGL